MALIVIAVQHGVVCTIEHRVDLPSEVRRVLDIARSQFGNRGFERTTIRSVASEAGVDPASSCTTSAARQNFSRRPPGSTSPFPISRMSRPTVLPMCCCRCLSRCGDRRDRFSRCCARLRRIVSPQMPCSRFSSTKWRRPWPRSLPITLPNGPPWWDHSCLASPSLATYFGVPPLSGMDDALLIEWLRPVLAHYLADPAP
jgi:hypothetical protein